MQKILNDPNRFALEGLYLAHPTLGYYTFGRALPRLFETPSR